MVKKIKLLVITHSYPTKVNPTAGIFIKNQYDYIKNYCDIKIIHPYPYVPKFKRFNPYHEFSTVPFKENIGGIVVYHPKYLFFPKLGIFSNKWLLLAVSVSLLLQLLILFTPLSVFFKLAPLNLSEWLQIGLAGLIFMILAVIVMLLESRIFRKKAK